MKTFSIFFGILIALAGINIILKAIFHISIPFFRVLIGVLFIYVGISFLVHRPIFFNYKSYTGHSSYSKYDIVFSSESKFDISMIDTSKSSSNFEINSAFSTSVLDLTDIENQDTVKTIEINAVFSQAVIYISETANLNIMASAAFGESVLPNNERVVFGDIVRKNTETNAVIDLKVNSVFGQARIEYKK